MTPFRDRTEAGKRLAEVFEPYRGQSSLLVLALPRGGVPVAFEVAESLQAPLDVFIVRKLGVPGHEELAMGALASGGIAVLNKEVVGALLIPELVIAEVVARERLEIERRERAYRAGLPEHVLRGMNIILIDDGLATGSTMKVAVRAIRELEPASIVVGVPVAARSTCDAFRGEVDEVICAGIPEPFRAVGLWYDDFSQVTDEEVRMFLGRNSRFRQKAA